MAVTKLQLYNDALRAIGDIRLVTTTDDVEARYVLDDAWVTGLPYVFSEGLWNFASKSTSITGTSSTACPGYSFIFTKPSDWVRTILISTNSLFDVEAIYRDEGGSWYANWSTLYLRYISSTLAADGSVGSWPISFGRMVSAYLAMECAERLTGSDNKKADLVAAYKDTLATAKNKDAMDQPAITPRAGKWVRSMVGGSTYRDRGPLTGY